MTLLGSCVPSTVCTGWLVAAVFGPQASGGFDHLVDGADELLEPGLRLQFVYLGGAVGGSAFTVGIGRLHVQKERCPSGAV